MVVVWVVGRGHAGPGGQRPRSRYRQPSRVSKGLTGPSLGEEVDAALWAQGRAGGGSGRAGSSLFTRLTVRVNVCFTKTQGNASVNKPRDPH